MQNSFLKKLDPEVQKHTCMQDMLESYMLLGAVISPLPPASHCTFPPMLLLGRLACRSNGTDQTGFGVSPTLKCLAAPVLVPPPKMPNKRHMQQQVLFHFASPPVEQCPFLISGGTRIVDELPLLFDRLCVHGANAWCGY